MNLDRHDALLVIDLQPDFMPGGALAVDGGNEIAAPLGRLARHFADRGALVVATQDFHPAGHVSFASSHAGRKPFESMELYGAAQTLWPDHCVAGSAGAELADALPDDTITLILRKGTDRQTDSYSAFRENLDGRGGRRDTGLAGWLRGREVRRVFVAGLARDVCVKWTALDGAAAGFEVCFVDDLTRAVNPASRTETDAALAAAGVRHVQSTELCRGDAQ